MDISNKTFVVVGTGKSGVAAAELLLRHAKKVYLYDGNEALDVAAFRKQHQSLNAVELILGTLPAEIETTLDIAVLSPGVPLDIPVVEQMKAQGIRIWGEIELAYVLGKGKVVAITGTNGKTTTTTLVGQIMARHFAKVQVVGNIGIPYTSVVEDTTEDTVVVAEISSFQLETIQTFAPKAAAILNITPDHLNRHHTMENYIAAKESIVKNQSKEDVCVLNYNDEVLRDFGKTLEQNIIYFSSTEVLEEGFYLDGNEIMWARNGGSEPIISVEELHILGAHNYENAMAAIALCDGMGVPMQTICDGLRAFHAVEHRIEFVCKKNDIAFYNDSKGTNPDAAIKGICAMNRKTVLIGGGYDKESTYDEWIDSFHGKVKKLILIGQTAQKIAACAKAHGFTDYVFADSLEEAITIAYETAEPGEAVLLSPACASWGMFDNYEQRGDIFKEYVRNLKE